MMSLGLDVAFAVLLVVTICYAIILNRKLGNLRKHKEELEHLAATFSQSTARAEDSIRRLKGTTEDLQKGIEKAQGLRDDLTFLIDRGSLAADRLEEGVRGARKKSESAEPSVPKHPVEPIETISETFAARRSKRASGVNTVGSQYADHRDDENDPQKSQAERDLIKALRQVQ